MIQDPFAIIEAVIKAVTAGDDPPSVRTSEEMLVKSATGSVVMSFDSEENLRAWYNRQPRNPNLRFARVTRIEEEVQINF